MDTGMNRPECEKALRTGLDEIGIDLARTDIIATHLHADHQGLVSNLLTDGAKAFMGEPDASTLKAGTTRHAGRGFLAACILSTGLSDDELQAMADNHPGFKYGPQSDVDYVYLHEGDTFEAGNYTLTAVATPGHTPGHICLYEAKKKILFSGDHVLGDITPNIVAWMDRDDPLDQYIKSLENIKKLDVEMCLPGHRSEVGYFRNRVNELIEHHKIRANEVVSGFLCVTRWIS